MKEGKVKHIGELKERVLVFGGVYGNFQALQRLRETAQKAGFSNQNIICTGDVVAYCAQPEECVSEMRNWNVHCIAGNVELQVASGAEDCGCDFSEGSRCDEFSKEWYPFVQEKLSQDSQKWMGELPEFIRFKFAGKEVLVVHGSIHETSEFVFKSTPWNTKALNFSKGKADVILAGHSGLPFKEEKEGKLWLNAGVIGMPANDGTTQVWYAVLEETEQGINTVFNRLEYDNELASRLMSENGLPEPYAKTLLTGLWDNCEILPEKETQDQGKKLAP